MRWCVWYVKWVKWLWWWWYDDDNDIQATGKRCGCSDKCMLEIHELCQVPSHHLSHYHGYRWAHQIGWPKSNNTCLEELSSTPIVIISALHPCLKQCMMMMMTMTMIMIIMVVNHFPFFLFSTCLGSHAKCHPMASGSSVVFVLEHLLLCLVTLLHHRVDLIKQGVHLTERVCCIFELRELVVMEA